MSRPVITTVSSRADLDTAARLIATTFDDLVLNQWLVPDPDVRIPAFERFFGMLTDHAAAGAGRVLLADGGRAAAVWFDRTVEPTEPQATGPGFEELAEPWLDRFAELDAAFEAVHPVEPHWHCAFLAVDKEHQGHGLGSALMAHQQQWLDEQRLPAYLEATSADSQRLYQRLGFVDMTPDRIVVGEPAANDGFTIHGAVLQRMWREPLTS